MYFTKKINMFTDPSTAFYLHAKRKEMGGELLICSTTCLPHYMSGLVDRHPFPQRELLSLPHVSMELVSNMQKCFMSECHCRSYLPCVQAFYSQLSCNMTKALEMGQVDAISLTWLV